MNVSKSTFPLFEPLESRQLLSTYFVSSTGSDSANGSAGAPWQTIQRAANVVKAGDTVDVAAGTYAGFQLGWTNHNNGTAAAPIVFSAAPGVVINRGNNKTPDGIDIEGNSYITIMGFAVKNAGTITRAGIRAVGTPGHNSDGIVIESNIANDCGDWGIFTAFSNNSLIRKNTASDSKLQHGIYVSNSSIAPHVIGNIVFGNLDCGIHLNGDASQGGSGEITNALIEGNIIYNNGVGGGSAIDCDGVQNSIIENNLLYGNHASGISLFQIDGKSPSTGNIVTNNTIVEAPAARWCINIVNASTGNTVDDNILDNQNPTHGAINISADSLRGFTSDHNAIIGNRFTANDGASTLSLAQWRATTGQDRHSFLTTEAATFVTAGTDDFILLLTSICVNGGTSLDAPTTDILGNLRPKGGGWDIGAYQVTGK